MSRRIELNTVELNEKQNKCVKRVSLFKFIFPNIHTCYLTVFFTMYQFSLEAGFYVIIGYLIFYVFFSQYVKYYLKARESFINYVHLNPMILTDDAIIYEQTKYSIDLIEENTIVNRFWQTTFWDGMSAILLWYNQEKFNPLCGISSFLIKTKDGEVKIDFIVEDEFQFESMKKIIEKWYINGMSIVEYSKSDKVKYFLFEEYNKWTYEVAKKDLLDSNKKNN